MGEMGYKMGIKLRDPHRACDGSIQTLKDPILAQLVIGPSVSWSSKSKVNEPLGIKEVFKSPKVGVEGALAAPRFLRRMKDTIKVSYEYLRTMIGKGSL